MEKLITQPEDAELRYQIGSTLLRYDSPSDGLGWLLSVLDVDPHHRPTHAVLAEYYAGKGNEKLAEHHRHLAGDSAEAESGS